MECYCCLRTVQDLLTDGENSIRKTFWRTTQRSHHPVWLEDALPRARQHGPAQLELVDQENSEGIQHIGCYKTGERLRNVSLVNTFNVNQFNPLSPHMSRWVEPTALRQPDL